MLVEQAVAPDFMSNVPSRALLLGNDLGIHQLPLVENKPKKNRTHTERGFRRYARENDWDCQFIRRSRPIVVPFDEFMSPMHTGYATFLQHPSIVDGFQSHDQRRAWQTKKAALFKEEEFDRNFVSINQLSGNLLGSVIEQTRVLTELVYSSVPALPTLLEQIATGMCMVFGGMPDESQGLKFVKKYRELQVEEKLKIVNDFSDLIVNALWAIAHYTNPSPRPHRINTTKDFRSPEEKRLTRQRLAQVPLLA